MTTIVLKPQMMIDARNVKVNVASSKETNTVLASTEVQGVEWK
ncbi:hypothetical protein [Paenibacillus cymbidii]|nr:hypothetical protein [Paenibacillus cymbidii]